jgi:putative SOS response-associated peptidase YedK
MCSLYRIDPGRLPASRGLQAAAAALPDPLIRITGRGLACTAGGGIAAMRWGFARDFNKALHNARAERLDQGAWREAFRARRCLLPLTGYYEWAAVPRGPKQAFEIGDPGEGPLWAAGLWENPGEGNACFTMVTVPAAPVVAAIHDRMPALLAPAAARAWLERGELPAAPYPGPLAASACPSPLKRPTDPAAPSQGELF